MKNYFQQRVSLLLFSFFMSSLLALQSINAQSYTYEAESFEEEVWNTASNSSNSIQSQTGTWTVAKNNIHTNAITAQDGTYSLLIATKSNALISPKLENGAGVLTYYVSRPSGGGRTIMVHTSTDMQTWSDVLESFSTTAEWTARRVEINDPEVRYIRFSTNSNGNVYIDNVKISNAGATDVFITTSTAFEITQTSANIGGNISIEGSKAILSRGVCYNTEGFPDVTSKKVEVDGTTGSFTVLLDHLTPGTTYYAKAYATTTEGVNYGNEISFTTRLNDVPLTYWIQDFNNAEHLPSGKSDTPQEINVPEQGTWIYSKAYPNTNQAYIPDGSSRSLRMEKNGSYVITPILDNGITNLSFDEGRGDKELTIYISTNNGTQWSLLNTITTTKGSENIVSVNQLNANRIKIVNESGGDADIDNIRITIYPSGTIPVMTTIVATEIERNTALSGGIIVSEGSKPIVEKGVCWSLESVPLLADNRTIDNTSGNSFISQLTKLPAGKLIYYRSYARSYAGTGYGETYSFTTKAAEIPIVSTTAATNITAETAISGGTISDNGGTSINVMGVCWSTLNEPTIEDNKTTDKFDNNHFISKLTKLTPDTRYYYRAYATNEAGTGYGESLSFTTGNISIPAVSTSELSEILSYQVTGGGIIINTGNAPVVAGLCWNETGAPTINDKATIIEDAQGTFTSSISNLKGNTQYYIRAYATNSAGTSYGEELSFKTTSSNIFYISPEGNDNTADGSFEKPFYSLQTAVDLVSAGDTIFMLEGTYNYSTRINIKQIGAPNGGTIYLSAIKGKRALLDFSTMPLDPNNQGIRITGSYWHIYGLDIKGAGDNGILIERNKPIGGTPDDIKNKTEEGHHNIIEFCSFYDNKDTGLQLKNMAEYNRIINCDSYFNRDAEDGNADGFAAKLSLGTGNYFYGCRAWNNSDDGWDGILYDAKEGFDDDMTTTYENCWAFRNGFLKNGSESKGNGNGFKLGGSGNMNRRHNAILKRCLAFDNLMKGFDQNHNTGSMTLINCTGHSNQYLSNKNHYTYKIDENILAPGKELTLINCVAIWDGIEDPKKSLYTPLRLLQGIRQTCDFMTVPNDYISVDTTGVTTPRKTDGSLPELNFMRIKPNNTKLIDTGTAVDGIEYNGNKPDLGCFETDGGTTNICEFYEPSAQASDFLIYPQPVSEQCTIQLFAGTEQSKYSLSLFDVNGKIILHQKFTGNSTVIERGHITSGFYLIRITDEVYRNSYNSKIIFD